MTIGFTLLGVSIIGLCPKVCTVKPAATPVRTKSRRFIFLLIVSFLITGAKIIYHFKCLTVELTWGETAAQAKGKKQNRCFALTSIELFGGVY
jgi:hypothetical protein